MKTTPTLGIISVVLVTLMFSGCNHSSNSNPDTTEYYEQPTQVDPKVMLVDTKRLLEATLTDNSGQTATRQDDGTYRFENNITFPVTATNGYIDANSDGIVNNNEVVNEIEFHAAEGRAVTLASTLASDSVMRTVLEDDFGLTSQQITSKTPDNDQDLEVFSKVLFDYMQSNAYTSVSTISEEALRSLVSTFTTQRDELEGVDSTDVPVNDDSNDGTLPPAPGRDYGQAAQ